MSDAVIKVINMFYVPLITLKCNDWDKKKLVLNDLSKDLCLSKDNMMTDFESQERAGRWLYNDKIQKLFANEIEAFCNVVGLAKAEVTSSWFEVCLKFQNHPIHTHGSLGYSAVCYVDFDKEEHQSTQFIAPFLNFINGDALKCCVPDAEEGVLAFFPSNILHQALPNNSNKPRKIMSFNLRVTQKDGAC